jgi:hypothetical protein
MLFAKRDAVAVGPLAQVILSRNTRPTRIGAVVHHQRYRSPSPKSPAGAMVSRPPGTDVGVVQDWLVLFGLAQS